MDKVGTGDLAVYPLSAEYLHEASADPYWQESVLLHFWDDARHLGGYFRIGHEPNVNGGQLLSFCNLVTPDGIFHDVRVTPEAPGDISRETMSCADGALSASFDGTALHWRVRHGAVTADLDLIDHHPPIDCFPKSSDMSRYAPAHLDVACRVVGTISAGGKIWQVDGMGMRDRGWGAREWGQLVSQRWNYATFDADNSFYVVAVHTVHDQFVKFAWVQRGDRVIFADHVESIAHVAVDGVSNRGGLVRLHLPGGEILEAHFEAKTPCVTFWLNDTLVLDNFCAVRWGDRVGVGNFETSCNIMRGKHRPRAFDAGTIDGFGWHPRP